MPERMYPEEYMMKTETRKLEEIPYVIPLPVWILLGIALTGLIIIAVYSISKRD